MKHQSSRRKKSKKRESPKPVFTILLTFIVLLLAASIYFSTQYTIPHTLPEGDVVAQVNGQEITQARLDFQYNLLPADYKTTFDREQVLEQIIDEELLVQASQTDGIVITPQHVNERVQQILVDSSMSVSDLQKNMELLNVTQEEFERLIERQLSMEVYLNKTLVEPFVDDTTLQAIYDATKSDYAIEEQVTVRHVLISTQRNDAALLAKNVYETAQTGADFCTLAMNYSDDRGSRNTCGQYTFSRGYMVPEFEEAAFTMKNDEVQLIQTQFGYHIVTKINTTSAGVRSFEEVKEYLHAHYGKLRQSSTQTEQRLLRMNHHLFVKLRKRRL